MYKQLMETAENAGLKIISDKKCCQLLAWLYAYGGGEEAVVLNERLQADILAAQKRLNLEGGEKPNMELLPNLQAYCLEVEPYLKGIPCFIHPDWVMEICERYGVKIRK